jgi:hypothetical protein
MDFVQTDGAGVKFTFLRPGSGQAPILTTEAYDVEGQAELGVTPDAFASLLDWLRARLAAPLGGSVSVAADTVERAFRRSALVRGRQRVGLLARKLESRFALPGWHLKPLRWPTESTGEVVVRGPAGAEVKVCFTLGVRANRSQIGVDFQVIDPSHGDSVKAAVDQLVVLLRGTLPQPPSQAGAAAAIA